MPSQESTSHHETVTNKSDTTRKTTSLVQIMNNIPIAWTHTKRSAVKNGVNKK
ncbi:hypothetical protein M419DRAFT_119413 [Trichoderma reesei RUT C-30]|uniref:Uncharacterized protein n=1 Tax=Hypocrea jecorina (strain ATCC 56765 / BCRC 32924 / NRRL 11460 / Rut C-30) TaxID=1344414 RepID=A0A024S7I3_HYPJR|nr:hypothetical protein M419DRAFT_119413 [Trichoderma reesei RUT C-30]